MQYSFIYTIFFKMLNEMSKTRLKYIPKSMYQLNSILTLVLTSDPKPKNITLIIRKPTPF